MCERMLVHTTLRPLTCTKCTIHPNLSQSQDPNDFDAFALDSGAFALPNRAGACRSTDLLFQGPGGGGIVVDRKTQRVSWEVSIQGVSDSLFFVASI